MGGQGALRQAAFWNLGLAVREAVISGEWPFCSAQGKPFETQGKPFEAQGKREARKGEERSRALRRGGEGPRRENQARQERTGRKRYCRVAWCGARISRVDSSARECTIIALA